MTPYAREEQKLKAANDYPPRENTIFLKSLCWQYFNFDRSFVFRLTACLHPTIFADTNLGTLSKDHTGTLCQHSRKGYPI